MIPYNSLPILGMTGEGLIPLPNSWLWAAALVIGLVVCLAAVLVDAWRNLYHPRDTFFATARRGSTLYWRRLEARSEHSPASLQHRTSIEAPAATSARSKTLS